MNPTKSILLLSSLLVSSILASGCSRQSRPIAFHATSSYVDNSNSSWSEPIYAKKGQSLEAVYSLSISKGTWAIWFTRSTEADPKFHYSAYDSDYAGAIKYPVPQSGKYVLHIESKSFTGSFDVTMRLNK